MRATMSGTTNNRFTVVFAGLIAVAAAPVVRAQADTLIDPPSIASVSGRLVVTLTAAPASVIIGGEGNPNKRDKRLFPPPPPYRRNRGFLEATPSKRVGPRHATKLFHH